MYNNEQLIPKAVAEKAVKDYALLYTKVEGSKQYVRNRYNEGLKALNAYKKAFSKMLMCAIPTGILAYFGFTMLQSEQQFVGILLLVATVFVLVKWTGRPIFAYFKALKWNTFAKECEKEFLALNKALGGKQTSVWTDAFLNETVNLVGAYMNNKYRDVHQRINAFNKQYAEYRDFVNLNSQWDKTPILAQLFQQGLVTSINEALREYARQKDAEEIKSLQRQSINAINNMAGEVRGICNEVSNLKSAVNANTAATVAGAKAVVDSVDNLNNTLKS